MENGFVLKNNFVNLVQGIDDVVDSNRSIGNGKDNTKYEFHTSSYIAKQALTIHSISDLSIYFD